MTARNIQVIFKKVVNHIKELAKKNGTPWTVAKGYDTFTPIGSFIPKKSVIDPNLLKFTLENNNKSVQTGCASDMIFSYGLIPYYLMNRIPEIIEYASTIMTLETGDLILTGTPAGVGTIKGGDILKGKLTLESDVLSEIEFTCANRS